MLPASSEFLQAMNSPTKRMHIKLELYDNKMNYLKEVTLQTTKESLGEISIDADRPVRRSFTFSLLNDKQLYNWGEENLIWIDKRVILYIGLEDFKGEIHYVQQGVFVVSEPEDSNSMSGRIANITGFDKAFLMTDKRGKFINETTLEVGANIGTAIRIIAQGAGETMFNFDTIDKTIPYEITYQSSDNRWNAIEELALLAECDVYYDVYGYLRLKKIDLNQFENEPIVWSYKFGDKDERYYSGNVRKMDESELANYVRVLAGSGQTAEARFDLVVDENDLLWENSPYSIQKIGTVLYEHNNGSPDSVLETVDECKWRAKFELMKRLGFTERLEMNISPNFLHDANDIIEIEDPVNDVSGKYLLDSFSIPLTPSLMTLNCKKYRKVIDDWDFI